MALKWINKMSKFEVLDIFSRKFESPPILSKKTVQDIQSGDLVNDDEFDMIFPHYYSLQSPVHWSPIAVARQIAEWINPLKQKKIIDIGCGVGKLCILLQILTQHRIYGIEQRDNLVQIANEIVNRNGLKNISIKNLNMLDLNWEEYDIYYLYNPFQEHVSDDGPCIIETNIELDKKYFVHYTAEVFRQLTWAKQGKQLITFHGFGGRMPSGWRLLSSRHIEDGDLMMWVKEKS